LLRQSGLRSEKDITTFEQLALKKVSVDEIRLRQAQLRAMRELLFRQDQKAKRIAKIKSKQYRRVHKRERERRKRIDGEEDDEEDKMKAEMTRAKERMTLRHKNTGEWAKKVLTRGQHDLETRQAISEQLRRGDDLRRKILGNDDAESDVSDSAEELEDVMTGEGKWGEEAVSEQTREIRKGVLGMKFMRDAEERQRRENEKEMAEMRATLDEQSGEEEAELPTAAVAVGRKKFTPGDEKEKGDKVWANRMAGQDEMADEEEIVLKMVKNPFHMNNVLSTSDNLIESANKSTASENTARTRENSSTSESAPTSNPWLAQSNTQEPTQSTTEPTSNPWLSLASKSQSTTSNRITKIQQKRKRESSPVPETTIDVSFPALTSTHSTSLDPAEDPDTPEMTYSGGRIAFQQQELVNRAFAGDDLEAEFQQEKAAVIAEDAPREEDVSLPGWGSWTGKGVKRRATAAKLVKKIPGIEAAKRKDAKLSNVIINEKKAKNVRVFLAGGG
jgi:U3 small nucleolar RNA-associated protein 14